MISRTTPKRATQTSPSAAHPAVKHGAANATVSVVGMIEARARCIPWSAPIAARMPQSHSSPEMTVRFTVVIATADGAAELPQADIRPDHEGGEKIASLMTKITDLGQRV